MNPLIKRLIWILKVESFQQQGAGAILRTYSDKGRDTIHLADFLTDEQKADVASREGTIDCLPALHKALAAAVQSDGFVYPSAGRIELPRGVVFLNGTLTLEMAAHLVGHGSGQSGGNYGTTLRFPANTKGIVAKKGDNSPLQYGADASIFEGVFLQGSGSSSSAHGIDMQARIKLRDMSINGFGGNGVNIVADVSENTNANLFAADTVTITGCGGHGWYVQGGDTNAGVAIGINASGNGGWGIYDSSFLGNTYKGCHTAANALGPYKSDNANARNVFIGCYSEGGQPASVIDAPSMVIGGLHGAELTGTGYFAVDGGFDRLKSKNGSGHPEIAIGTGTGTGDDPSGVLSLKDPSHPSWPIVLKWITGRWRLMWANLDSGELLSIYAGSATVENGYARDLSASGGLGFRNGYYAGAGMKYRGVASAAPTTGAWLRGDIVYSDSPSASGSVGWVCTSGGSPGTWKTFGAISA